MKPGSIEDIALAAIRTRHPSAKRRGARQALRDLLEGEALEMLEPDRYTPDAWMATDRRFTWFEIEDQNTLARNKLIWLALLDDASENLDIALVVTDRYGHNETVIDLEPVMLAAWAGDKILDDKRWE